MEDTDVIHDNEQFSLDDDLTRRLIYGIIVGPLNDIVTSYAFNFVAADFAKGATQWRHLKEPFAALFNKMCNLAGFAIGNKRIDVVLSDKPNQKKPRSAPEVSSIVAAAITALDKWYGKCRNNDNIVLDIETLFDATITSKVVGYRVWLHAKVTRSETRLAIPVSVMSAATRVMPIQSSSEYEVPVDVLGSAMRHSLQESASIIFNYTKQKQMQTKRKFGKATVQPRNQASVGLYPLYSYALNTTVQDAFSNIFRKCLSTDQNRDTCEGPVEYPVFKDSREVASINYSIEDEYCASNVIKKTFTKEAAMFYHVRTANVHPEQRNLNSYISSIIDRVPAYDPDTINDVKQLVDFGVNDSSIGTYYNEQTTYRVRNDHISAEFFYNMPLPHRIGAQLPTRQQVGIVGEDALSHEDDSREAEPAVVPNRMIALAEEDDDEEDEEDIDLRQSGKTSDESSGSSSFKILDHMYDEAWLAEHDLDGSIAQRIFDHPLNYGYKQTVLKPLGLHQVSFIVNAHRILACRIDSVNSTDLEKLTDDMKRRIIDKRREHVLFLIEGTVLRSGGKACSQLRLLAGDHQMAGGANSTSNGVASNATDTSHLLPENEVYMASTMNGAIDPSPVAPLDETDEPRFIPEEERVPFGFRSENGEFLNEDNPDLVLQEGGGHRFYGNRHLDDQIPFLKRPNNKSFDKEYASFVANATLPYFLAILAKRRPEGNTMKDVAASPDVIRDEEWMLERDVYLRMCALNKQAFRALDREYFNATTRQIPPERYAAYKTEKNRLITAALIEVWHEFFNSPDVSYANEGIRGDWVKMTTQILDGKKRIAHSHHTRVTRLEVLPYHQFKIWRYELYGVVLDVHHNQKIMDNNYMAKFHHCRWQVDSNNPTLNIINHGDNMGGKSFILKNVKKTCPTMVGDMVTQITDKAFNVDRNLNDMLIIIEEMENKYLGIVPGGNKGGTSSGEGDALNFFKNRLTSGITATLYFFIDEEHGNRRDCKQAKSSCQGSYLCATNAKLADADKNILTRFTLQSVAKSFADKSKSGPKAGSSGTKPQFGTEQRQHDIIYEEHKDIHRLYYFIEQCVKSNVLNNNAYGVSIDGANIQINSILDKMHLEHGIPTDITRKRNSIIEMARCMCIAYACWLALTSPAYRHLQYDPDSGEYIGINPRLILEGVFPNLVITKDMVIDALTSLSGQWQHDHLKNVLQSIVASTYLTRPIDAKYRFVTQSDLESASSFTDSRRPQTPYTVNAARAAEGERMPMRPRGQVGIATQGGVPVYLNAVPDYNYVSLTERDYVTIYKNIAKLLGELQISANDIEKILKELSDETLDIAIRGYILEKGADTPAGPVGSLSLDTGNMSLAKPKIVVIDHCPRTSRARVSILVAYLKEQLPLVLNDSIVHDLRRYQMANDNLENGGQRDEEQQEGEVKGGEEEEEGETSHHTGEMDDGDEEMMNSSVHDMEPTEGGGECIEDETYTLCALIAKLEKAARYEVKGETPLIKSIVSFYENSVLDLTDLPSHVEGALRKEYETLYSKYVPWDRHCTADHPTSISIYDVYKSSEKAIRHNNKISKEITFYDTVKSLTLRRKGTDSVVIPNQTYVSPSAMATLSIFDPLIIENDIIKATQHIYNKSSSWELTEDIDFTCGKAHLANLAYQPLDTEDIRFMCINFQPFLFQIHADYSHTRLEKHKLIMKAEREARKKKLEEAADTLNLAKLQKEEDDEHIASVMCEYPLCSMLSKVNHQGDIINNTLYGCDANSVQFHEMLLANSVSMKNDFLLHNTSMLKAKKRGVYKNAMEQQQAHQKAREKVNSIFNDRLKMKAYMMSNKNIQTATNKRAHTGVAKTQVNRESTIQHIYNETMAMNKRMSRMAMSC